MSADHRSAECGALGAESPPIDPDLAMVALQWAQLPEAIRAGIVAMVKSASKAE